MTSLAVITARGGSKRIPRKNVRPFMGQPMIAYAIGAAKESGLFDEVMVSTDDAEIADIARSLGASVPFLRSAATANDFATTKDVIQEVLGEYEARGEAFDTVCCIYPCVPFLSSETLRRASNAFVASGADGLMPVVRFSFPIQRAVVRDARGLIAFREPKYALVRTQDIEPTYHDVGMFYFLRTRAFAREGAVMMSKMAMFEMNESEVQDIDTLDDWMMAEVKFRYNQERRLQNPPRAVQGGGIGDAALPLCKGHPRLRAALSGKRMMNA